MIQVRQILSTRPEFYIKPGEKEFFTKVTAIVFDVDRTLADITKGYEHSIRGATAAYLSLMGIPAINEANLAQTKDFYPLWQKPPLADVWYLTYALTAYYLLQLILNNSNTEYFTDISQVNVNKQASLLPKIGAPFANKKIEYDFAHFVPLLGDAAGEKTSEVIENAASVLLKRENTDPRTTLQKLRSIWSTNLLKAMFQQMYTDEKAYMEEYEPKYGRPLLTFRADWNNDATTIPPTELRSFLATLREQGYSLGIATARPDKELRKFLETFQLAKYFSPEAIIPHEGGNKRDRIEKALAELTLRKIPRTTAAVYIDDTIGAVAAVRELQEEYLIRSVAVNVAVDDKELYLKNCRRLITEADAYIATITTLPKILRQSEGKV